MDLESLKSGKFSKVVVSKEMLNKINGGKTFSTMEGPASDSDYRYRTANGAGNPQLYDSNYRTASGTTVSTSPTIEKGFTAADYEN